jgi:penicillin-binding protein 1B
MLVGMLAGLLWAVWIDFQVRRDFESLQWALPARIYARPVELYVGAHLSAADLADNLERLGYRRTAVVEGPGEFQISGSTTRLWTRGFDFWDGDEPSLYVEVNFSGQRVTAVRGSPADPALALVRLEPVEISQINPDTGEDRLPLSRSSVPDALVHAVIAVEDQRFYSHFGIDPAGIARALVSNLRSGSIVQGGSTLTQQLVKNLYLNRDRTLRRKVEEAVMALSLELHFSKDEILTAYMNEVFLGQEGNRAIHGFALAAEYYFGSPLNELTLAELALLAGMPQGPSIYNPRRNPERAATRRNIVLARMADNGYITAAELAQARAAEVQVTGRPASRTSGYPAFMDLVRQDLARDYDATALRTEGLRIFTTLDLRIQTNMEAVLEGAVRNVERPTEGSRLEAAVVITDASTGEVRALAGSRQTGSSGFNRALRAIRPIGSLVKPAVYLAALETGEFNLASVLSDRPVTIESRGSPPWSPRNFDNRTFGDVYLHDALERSMNLATVDLGMKIGVENVTAMLARLGHGQAVQPFPSVLLGSVNMAPVDVAAMYQTLASNGFRSPLRAVEAVTTGVGERLTRYGIESEQVADPASMYLLEYAMQGVFDRGTARSAQRALDRNLPLAGKTGTTNDERDSWFAGYGADLLGVVWLGHDDNRETGLTGASGALRVWSDIMTRLDIQPRQSNPPPGIQWRRVSDVPVFYATARDCSKSQQLPFAAGQLPDQLNDCETNDSMIERVFDRFRSLIQ